MDVIVYSIIQAVVTTMGIWFLQKSITKRDKAAQEREKAREDMEYNLLTAVNASIALGEATARGVKRIPGANCNGDMTAALEYTTTVKHELKNFLNRKAVEKII
ncbi:serine/threonine protein kinase [Anaerotignum sp. MB30-C6]|uniref:serine/threonine protein kinase n=1 Tax=Anaerotignum sp. MB30-C6 TaxID=3070814 RepID=UPI0027DE0721|nr:serine/threonine protein kinase [Anaerotignum sp. MB30-C6]WMI81611.1 serine/threonine protein kinase [Anaerotignum sp. MB30-C6]